jgi:hypothetical protein
MLEYFKIALDNPELFYHEGDFEFDISQLLRLENKAALPYILRFILTPSLAQHLTPIDLHRLALYSQKAGKLILEDETLCNKLQFLTPLLWHSQAYAKKLLETPSLCSRIIDGDLHSVCLQYPSIHQFVKENDPTFFKRILDNHQLKIAAKIEETVRRLATTDDSPAITAMKRRRINM